MNIHASAVLERMLSRVWAGCGFSPATMKKALRMTVSLLAFATTVYAHGGEAYKPAALPFGLDPAHLHLLTNHMPIFVTFSGLVVLGLALWWKSENAKRAALVLLLLGTVGGLMTYWLGQQAYKLVRGLADEVGQDWLDLHMERAEQVIWLYWLGAVSAAAALVAAWKKHRFTVIATLMAGAFGVATLGASGWIADAGGKIRHPEIRGASAAASADAGESSLHSH